MENRKNKDIAKHDESAKWLVIENRAYLIVGGAAVLTLAVQAYNLLTSGIENEIFGPAVKELEQMTSDYLNDPRVAAYKEYTLSASTQRNTSIELDFTNATRELMVMINEQTNSIVKLVEQSKIHVGTDEEMSEQTSNLEESAIVNGDVTMISIDSYGSRANDFTTQSEAQAANELGALTMRWSNTTLENLEGLLLSITSTDGVADPSLNSTMNMNLAALTQLEYIRQALGGDFTTATTQQQYKMPNGSYSTALPIKEMMTLLNYKASPRAFDFIMPVVLLIVVCAMSLRARKRGSIRMVRRSERAQAILKENERVTAILNNTSSTTNTIKTEIVRPGQPIDITDIEEGLEDVDSNTNENNSSRTQFIESSRLDIDQVEQ